MPVAIEMSGPGLSPTSPRMKKAAFFRARSPPVTAAHPTAERDPASPVDMLSQRLDAGLRIDSRGAAISYSPEEQSGMNVPNRGTHVHRGSAAVQQPERPIVQQGIAMYGYSSSGGTAGRTPPLDHPPAMGQSPLGRRPTNKRATELAAASALGTNGLPTTSSTGESEVRTFETAAGIGEGSEEGPGLEVGRNGGEGLAGGSNEMLLALLAGQAAMDCDGLPIGAWEEELSILSNRLSSLVARHQREVKILTAARTLQKLNNQNKRVSKQTMESLEQSEKRVEAAEKEVLVLRDREAGLRRQLMEHWSGVMAWEVRRLERLAKNAQTRYERQISRLDAVEAREAEWQARVRMLEEEEAKRAGRMGELEEMVVEMGRRERAVEEEVRELDKMRVRLEEERERLKGQLKGMERERTGWEGERMGFIQASEGWEREKRAWAEERHGLAREQERLMTEGRGSASDKAAIERVRRALGGLLGSRTMVGEAEVDVALEEVRALIGRREKEVESLRDEMREVNMGLEEELRRVSADRDLWKGKLDRSEQSHRSEITALERQTRSLNDQISELSLRNESLSTSLSAAQTAVASMSNNSTTTKTLQTKIDALTSELDSIAGQFNEVWTLLPALSRRVEASLASPTGSSTGSVANPSVQLNLSALQALYTPNGEAFGGVDEMVRRIRGLVDDGKVLVDRMIRMDKEKEVHKSNAAKAKKLVEDSSHALETYQKQVAVLEDRLAKSGSTESHFLEELNSLRSALDSAQIAKRNLETRWSQQSETVDRLQKANDTLSARALEIADEAEKEKGGVVRRMQGEIEGLRKALRQVEEGADEERSRGQAQRIQLLDELNSLQAEVGELRKQLRQARGGTAGK